MSAVTLPLFPLNTVLFPGGPLALRVFEARYLDMISRCLKEESGFGVVLIREGSEVGPAPVVHEVGTLVGISYWERRDDGLLGITVRGEQRFRIRACEVGKDQLITAAVELLPPEPVVPLDQEYAPLATLLKEILEQLDHPYVTLPRHLDDTAWVADRLAELLPIPLAQKQDLLATDQARERIERVGRLLAGQVFEVP